MCMVGFIIIITIYFKNIHFFHAQLGSDIFPDMRLLHISLNTTHSECKPSSSISSFTHSLQVFLPLPAHLTPTTSGITTPGQLWAMPRLPFGLPRLPCPQIDKTFYVTLMLLASCPGCPLLWLRHCLPPPHSYRLTPNHLHSYTPHAQTTSIYHASPPQPRSQPPKDCTNPHCASYPSATPCTSISPSSVPSSPDFADLQPSSPRSQSHMSMHSGHKSCISCNFSSKQQTQAMFVKHLCYSQSIYFPNVV